jgi:hypothetical protein
MDSRFTHEISRRGPLDSAMDGIVAPAHAELPWNR